MNTLDNLQLLLLAILHGKKQPISRYEAMATLNHVTNRIDRPYSPGAVYHCIKNLATLKMINFNHKLIEISSDGTKALSDRLIHAPLSESVLTIIYEAMALQLASNPTLKESGVRRLKVEMIKFNHFARSSASLDQESRRIDEALNCCHTEIVRALNKFILELGALK
jgi:hypothetical protein